jgi:hypothetical protein
LVKLPVSGHGLRSSANGRFLAYVHTEPGPTGERSTVHLFDRTTCQLRAISPTIYAEQTLGVSDGPDIEVANNGNVAALSSDAEVSRLHYYDHAAGTWEVVYAVSAPVSLQAPSLALADNGSRVYFTERSPATQLGYVNVGNVRVYDRPVRAVFSITASMGPSSGPPAVSADGTKVFFYSGDRSLAPVARPWQSGPTVASVAYRYDLETDQFTMLPLGVSGTTYQPRPLVSPSGDAALVRGGAANGNTPVPASGAIWHDGAVDVELLTNPPAAGFSGWDYSFITPLRMSDGGAHITYLEGYFYDEPTLGLRDRIVQWTRSSDAWQVTATSCVHTWSDGSQSAFGTAAGTVDQNGALTGALTSGLSTPGVACSDFPSIENNWPPPEVYAIFPQT